MSIMLSIDPATHGCGAALWENGKLIVAAYVANEKPGSGPRECVHAARAVAQWVLRGTHRAVSTLALEIPQIYSRGGGRSKGDPNGLLPLFGVDVALATIYDYAEVKYGTPHEWKGGTHKPKKITDEYIITKRVIERLAPVEREVIAWPHAHAGKVFKYEIEQSWDVSDAIGIGLSHLGRFAPHRALRRE